jgi:hypothetical protein
MLVRGKGERRSEKAGQTAEEYDVGHAASVM